MLILEVLRKEKLFRSEHGGGIVGFKVAEEPGRTSAFPVMRVIFGGTGAVAQRAEECVVAGTDDDTDVSRPNNQITGLRMLHSQEVIAAAIQVGGVRVGIGIAGVFVNRM